MKGSIVRLFEEVQSIPYKCRVESILPKDTISQYANCNQKRDILSKLLNSCGFETKPLDAIFDWIDLPIPREIIKILGKSGTSQKHHLIEVLIDNRYLKIDPTWNRELESLGFPVTVNWNGMSDTLQVTRGNLYFYNPKEKNIVLPYFPDERKEFARQFNKWLGWKA